VNDPIEYKPGKISIGNAPSNNRLYVSTRGTASWRESLTGPGRPWKPGSSAYELAVSWENSSRTVSGLPGTIEALFRENGFVDPVLVFAVAGHRLDLSGGGAVSRNDLWAMVKTAEGPVALTVEAKARESFKDDTLEQWLVSGGATNTFENRKNRWEFLLSHLPRTSTYLQVRRYLLHRCVASIIEARRLALSHSAFVIQSFDAADPYYEDYADFCRALRIPSDRGNMSTISMGDMSLSVGWVDCDPAPKKHDSPALPNDTTD